MQNLSKLNKLKQKLNSGYQQEGWEEMGRSGTKSAVYIQKSKVEDEPKEGLLSGVYYSKQDKKYRAVFSKLTEG